jgi:hypothetical protein
LWLSLPEVAVIVAVYVPDGVPPWETSGGPPPPQESTDVNRSAIAGAIKAGPRLRIRSQSQHDPSSIPIQISDPAPGGSITGVAPFAFVEAVVATFTVNGALAAGSPEAANCTEVLERLQLGAGDTAGVMAQLRLTVPLKSVAGKTDKSNLAVCPGAHGLRKGGSRG